VDEFSASATDADASVVERLYTCHQIRPLTSIEPSVFGRKVSGILEHIRNSKRKIDTATLERGFMLIGMFLYPRIVG